MSLRNLIVSTLFLTATALAQAPEDPRIQREIEALRAEHDRRMKELEARYESRLASLEVELKSVRGELDERSAAGAEQDLESAINATLLATDDERAGIGRLGQVTIFDNRFNPAISLVADFVLSASSGEDTFESLNRFSLRSVELGITGRVDPNVAYVFVLHADEGELELEEAYGLVDGGLPDTFRIKAGRHNLDFGKLSKIHAHDLPFVDHPGVLQEFLGGSLRGTGVEVHHWLPLGDSNLLRWSAGIVNDLDGDTHAVLGPLAGAHEHEEEGAEPFGERGFDDFAFHARLTALFEVGSESTVQAGASIAYAPNGRSFFEDPMTATVVARDLEPLVVGFDLAYKWQDETSGQSFTLAGEFLIADRRIIDEATLAATSSTPLGFYVYGEYGFDREWSVGTSFDWFERLENDALTFWDVGGYVTWRINEFQRLRLEVRYIDDELADAEDIAVLLQWTTIIGSHGHGVEW